MLPFLSYLAVVFSVTAIMQVITGPSKIISSDFSEFSASHLCLTYAAVEDINPLFPAYLQKKTLMFLSEELTHIC